jgi:hypothetical protein
VVCCSCDEGGPIVYLGSWRVWLPRSQQQLVQWATAEASGTWRVCWAVHCVCGCWMVPFGSYWFIWTSTNFLLFHYFRYCDSAIHYQSLLVLLSFLWTLRGDAIRCVRDLERIGSWSKVGSTKQVGFSLDLWGFFWEGCGWFCWAGVHMGRQLWSTFLHTATNWQFKSISYYPGEV